MHKNVYYVTNQYNVTVVNDMSETVNIAVKKETHTRLGKMGAKGETFDEIVNDLLNQADRLKQIQSLIDKASVAFESSKADFRNIFARLVAMAKAH